MKFELADIEEAFKAGYQARCFSDDDGWKAKNSACSEYMAPMFNAKSIIFLDIDGVLNNTHDTDDRMFTPHGFVNPKCVKFLNELIRETGAGIVVSSVWRLGLKRSALVEMISDLGVEGEVLGSTDSKGPYRGNEILRWLEENDMKYSRNYVILDDDSDMLLWQKDNYVSCDPYIGMTPRTVFKAKAILLNAPGQESS